jgi:hypothetical protein
MGGKNFELNLQHKERVSDGGGGVGERERVVASGSNRKRENEKSFMLNLFLLSFFPI